MVAAFHPATRHFLSMTFYWWIDVLEVGNESAQKNFQGSSATFDISWTQSLCLATNEAHYTALEGIRHI